MVAAGDGRGTVPGDTGSVWRGGRGVGIVDEDIARVREASDIVHVVSEHVQLKRVGRRWSGLCPFHSEKSPSFSVNQEQGLYYCFGCGAKGDVITFVREVDHLDFVAAVEKLAGTAGVTLRYTDVNEGDNRKRRSTLVEALADATGFYHQQLLEGPDGAAARKYLRSRGFSGDEVRHYQLGWAPDAWDTLVRHSSFSREVLVEAGLAFVNQRGRLTDAFRGRVLFPIFNANGDPVAFGGRLLPGAEGPKYKNSTGSPVYDKSSVLYGLNWAKGPIVAADEVIVCEGYTDVIGFAAVGLDRAVATCGTALTEAHVKRLRSYASRVLLAFDADAAGQNAAERFHEWEQRHGLDVAVVPLPVGSDPGDLARHDPQTLIDAVGSAVPFMRFRLDRVMADQDLTTVEGRSRAATAALTVVAQHPDPLVRDQYVMELSDQLHLPPDGLRQRLAEVGSQPPARRSGQTPSVSAGASRGVGDVQGEATGGFDRGVPAVLATVARNSPEVEVLRLVLAQPDDVAPSLHEVLFADPMCARAYEVLRAANWRVADVVDAPGGVVEFVQQLAVEQSTADPADVVERLVEAAGQRELSVLGAQARSGGDSDALAVASLVAWLKPQLEAMREPHTASAAASVVLGWLVQRHGERS